MLGVCITFEKDIQRQWNSTVKLVLTMNDV